MKPVASLSLDLDNVWSYMKTHGDAGWESFPSYFDKVVPRVLGLLKELDLKLTVFVVGQDAALDKNAEAIAAFGNGGHEYGNHSFHHEQWFHLNTEQAIEEEIAEADQAIENVAGIRPIGFRGPGFAISAKVLEVLARRGFKYDCSTFPTFLGPLARAYYFMTANLSKEEMEKRKSLFGGFREGLRSNKPYRWKLDAGDLIEIPVTTIPGLKVPFHASYILYLSTISPSLAIGYFRTALALCRRAGVSPSLLLHPLDFLGGDDLRELSFFPAMKLPGAQKTRIVKTIIRHFSSEFRVLPLGEHWREINKETTLKTVAPNFL